MQDITIDVKKQAKKIDPAWRILRVTRILSAVWLVLLITLIGIDIAYNAGHTTIQPNIFSIIFTAIYGILPIFYQVMRELHWNRIIQRRALALTNPEALRSSILNRPGSGTPDLLIPLHIQLRQSGKVILIILILMICVVIGGFVAGLLSTGIDRPLHLQPLLIVMGSLIGAILLILLLYFFIRGRYLTQMIDITEEGITTRYLNQQRSIRWDEVHVFGRYMTRGWGTAAGGLTYELSNDKTVVRWSQRPGAVGIVVKSSHPEYDDYNWLVGQLITLTMARTGQPLLNLEEPGTSNQSTRAGAVTIGTQNTPPLGQDDPFINNITKGRSNRTILIFGLIGAGATILGLLELYVFRTNIFLSYTYLLRYGIFMLIIMLLLLFISPRSKYFWLTIQRRRELAVQDPQCILATNQPVPNQDPPQPAKLYISAFASRQKQLRNTFLIFFIFLGFIAELFFFSLDPLYQLMLLASILLLSIVFTLLIVFNKSKTSMRRIDVSSNGLATHYITTDAQINWEDVRLFATYKNIKLFGSRSSADHIYELVGEQAVVRWSDIDSPDKLITTEPSMSREEYARWLAQLHGYITEKTHLPLHDLDQAV